MSFFRNWVVSICFCLLSFNSISAFASNSSNSSSPRQAFISELLELSTQCNNAILAKRKELLSLYETRMNGIWLSSGHLAWVNQLAEKYQVKNWNPDNKHDWDVLLSRVDIVPPSLLLAQAAIESAWGTSRFAVEGNNFFGQWCYRKGCGIVPLRRPHGASYEVRKFPTPLESVKAYISNLNTNATYHDFREKRAELRQANQPLSGYALASGLDRYSQLGEKYVGMVRGVIARYQLSTYR